MFIPSTTQPTFELSIDIYLFTPNLIVPTSNVYLKYVASTEILQLITKQSTSDKRFSTTTNELIKFTLL